jgi:hypothetical protein
MTPYAALAITVILLAPAAQSPSRRVSCQNEMNVAQKSFARIDGPGLKFTYVWVDAIQSKLVGGYDPFDVFIVTGKLYSPFEMRTGTLDRAAFERLSKPGRNIERFGPFRVPASISSSQPAVFRFSVDSKPYQLRTTGVKVSRFGGESGATIQACRE